MSEWAQASVLAILSLGLVAAVLTYGCETTVGPCADGNCPTVPGCGKDKSTICDSKHICSERVCEGVGWICGRDDEGNYVWLRKAAPCDDGSACTGSDICVAGICVGTPLTCNTPPKAACSGGTTLLTYTSQGSCQSGEGCKYPSKSVKCPGNCQGGKCAGSPCTGVTCDNPPSKCYQKSGVCKAGKCSYTPLAAGTACDPGDKCMSGATCDGKGKCSGGSMSCKKPHTKGASCVSGVCQGYQCESGWGNCNSTWSDGCETPLNSPTNCGGCKKKCGNVAHGSPKCSGGKCVIASCSKPWADCDGSYGNGCEIPVGVANACSKSGLTYGSGNPSGCGTAHCGSSSASNAKNFGKWTCTFCVQCHIFSNGGSWCLFGGSSPGKFSTDRCQTCCGSSSRDKVCSK